MKWSARRIGDFAAYLVIALAVGFSVIWFGYHSQGWGGLTLNTAILYGFFISWSKRVWRAWGFWLSTVSVLMLHLLVFIVILRQVDHWGALCFLPMYPVEIAVLSIACDWAVQLPGNPPHRPNP
jgi:hypothetical protein